ncbi:Eisosome component PIL1-domain-containing protein [Gautieria morchelliformis]|nr:Eisosome component PIL1-domain-containing protein [Gautieria morchelliformis]
MPAIPKFFDDLKDKAQSAISSTPLGAYVPGRESSQSSSSGGRSYAFDALQHQFRSLQVQYGTGGGKDLRQLQLIITGQKGVVLDLDKQGQDIKAVSKEFYIWGQAEDTDVKDVTDRLAYLTYVQGSLTAALASSLDVSRAPFKALRDAEAHMQPKRNIRANYELQISKLKNEGKPGTEAKIRELENLLRKAEAQDEDLEKEIDLLKRKAIVDSETQKWEAIREYGEKLVILSQACKPLLEVLPSVPPTTSHPYTGTAATAATRASLQKALDNYKPGCVALPAPDIANTETRSFGETHASELSRINSVADNHSQPSRNSPPLSPLGPRSSTPPSAPVPAHAHLSGSSPVNPSDLNNLPAPIPGGAQEPVLASTVTEPQSVVPPTGSVAPSTPTVAETGVPVAAGREGPGPSSGSLAGGHKRSQSRTSMPPGPGYGEAAPSYGGTEMPKYGLSDTGQAVQFESAEEEKQRLAREDRELLLRRRSSAQAASSVASSSAPLETAEDEKKRLDREERERVLNTETSQSSNSHGPGNIGEIGEDEADDGTVPPPYEDPQ